MKRLVHKLKQEDYSCVQEVTVESVEVNGNSAEVMATSNQLQTFHGNMLGT